MIESQTSATEVRDLTVWLVVAFMACVGALIGLIAQLLRQHPGAAMTLGAGTAVWVTIGFLLVLWTTRSWEGNDGVAWASVAAAAYLYGWLIAYHILFGVRENLTFAQVWPQLRYWLAAVAPACVAIGFVANRCRRQGWLGDVCLGLPLGWSLPDVFSSARQGTSYVLIVALPTLLSGMIPLVVARGRKWNFALTAVAVLVATVVFHFLHPYLRLDNG
jgi:hypothetical protein